MTRIDYFTSVPSATTGINKSRVCVVWSFSRHFLKEKQQTKTSNYTADSTGPVRQDRRTVANRYVRKCKGHFRRNKNIKRVLTFSEQDTCGGIYMFEFGIWEQQRRPHLITYERHERDFATTTALTRAVPAPLPVDRATQHAIVNTAAPGKHGQRWRRDFVGYQRMYGCLLRSGPVLQYLPGLSSRSARALMYPGSKLSSFLLLCLDDIDRACVLTLFSRCRYVRWGIACAFWVSLVQQLAN